ncbi:rhodanese-like domain-containing protein [Desulfogranum mediterraneum]|uniref:rhodanese-like domain-containing protein n=1 Tax=Desulfogranum mediterraneum TaxID=160661 RepID=UPI0004282B04|nr:rhodanese-like domain-containing protein [Desulfogranum mediterraneum]
MFNKICSILVLSLLISGAALASQEARPSPDQILKQRVRAAKQAIRSIDSPTLKQWIEDDDQQFLLLDVREPGEVTAGQIEADESMAIPRGLVEMQFIRKVKDLDKAVVIYCLAGTRGALAAQALTEMGYTNIYNLEGGLLEWIAAGHPVNNFFGEFELKNFDSNFKKKG